MTLHIITCFCCQSRLPKFGRKLIDAITGTASNASISVTVIDQFPLLVDKTDRILHDMSAKNMKFYRPYIWAESIELWTESIL
jgi:hypothetical protein